MSDPQGDGRGITAVPRVVRTEAALRREIAHVSRFKNFVLDVETTMEHPKSNEVSWVGLAVPDRVVLIPMGHALGRIIKEAHTEARLPPEEERKILASGKVSQAKRYYDVPAEHADGGQQLRPDIVFAALRPLFFSDRLKIGHNLKFDLESVAKYYGGEVMPGPYADTMILTHVLDENFTQYSLKELVMNWLNVPHNPAVRKQFYPNLGKVGVHTQPLDQVAEYLAKDVWYTHLYYRELLKLITNEPDLLKTYELEMAVYPALLSMELTGINIDTGSLKRVGDDLQQRLRAIEGRAWSICGVQFKVSNVNSRREFLFSPKSKGGQGLKPLTFSAKTNLPQLNQATLEHYRDENELARLFLEWSETDKLFSTFVTGLTDRLIKGRLHTSFNQHRTVTGRLSSRDPNLQQIPRGDIIRSTFVADPGHLLIVADYDQVELRCAAFLSADAEMLRVFGQGLDIHAQAAAAMLSKPLESVTKDERQIGKTQNFGTLYGAGPNKIAAVADCSLDQAKEFIERYFQQFSGLAAWKDRMIIKARNTGKRTDTLNFPYAEIPPFGRRRRLPDLYSPDIKLRARAERQVINSIVQGFAANVMKLALVDLSQAVKDTPYKLLLNVHDEVILQAPERDVEDAQKLLVSVMEGVTLDGTTPILGEVPLTAEAGIGKSWAEAK